MSEYSIRKLGESDWRMYREIRLKALKGDPSVFGSNFEYESNLTEKDWLEPLRRQADIAIFVIFCWEQPVGITGISVDRDDPTKRTAVLWGSWLELAARGKGLSKLFYEARIKWASEHATVQRVIVSHRASNLSSKFANQKFGFVPTHVTEKLWNDGSAEDEFHYELVLGRNRQI